MLNYEKYLGIPYKYRGTDGSGVDCITLCQMIGFDNNVKVGNINYEGIELANIYPVFLTHMCDKTRYVETTPSEHKLVVFRIMGKIQHIGYMVSDTQFVHILQDRNVALESINNPLWKNRIVGYYEYIGK